MDNHLRILQKFWKNKKVFITGHTGFKGSWLTIFFHILGAKVYGYSLKPEKDSLYNFAKIKQIVRKSYIGDIRNYKKLKASITKSSPNFLIHMAAQPLVRDSYDFPKYTYEVNTLGTLNILDILNEIKFLKSSLIITTDKVYKNNETKKHFTESDELGGFDPYSSSKACAELMCQSYSSILAKNNISCVTARSGNVIGGGDFALNRIIPDFFKAIKNKKKLVLRYPNAIRPWQHVIEPLFGYILLLMLISKKNKNFYGAWNFGPNKGNNVKVKKIVSLLNSQLSQPIQIKEKNMKKKFYKESTLLKLNSNKARTTLGWKPKFNILKTIKLISDWQNHFLKNKNEILNLCKKQIVNYISQY